MPDRETENIDLHDAQIRRRMLMIARLDGVRFAERFVPASSFLRATDDGGNFMATEQECEANFDALCAMGVLEEWSPVALGAAMPRFRERRFRLTLKGSRLWQQEIDPIPGIADDRFGD